MLIIFDCRLLMLTVLFLSQNVTYSLLCTHDDFVALELVHTNTQTQPKQRYVETETAAAKVK